MAAPASAQALPMQLGNASGPLCEGEVELTAEEHLTDSLGKPVKGTLSFKLASFVTQQWRYLFGTFAQKSDAISKSFTLTAGAGYSQTQMQALINQVALLSKQVGGAP